jgi:oligo-1,6-glucosidase
MEFLQGMKNEVLCKYDILSVGETPFFGIEDACHMTNEGRGVVNMLFHFELMDVDTQPGKQKWDWQPWKLEDIKSIMNGWQVELQGKGWNSLYLENHDQPRSVSRFGNDTKYRNESAKMLATWLHMMQGTAYIYQGQEIGMTNANFPSIKDYKDIETLRAYEEMIKKCDEETVMAGIRKKSRDNARTPFQWSSEPNGGFTTGTPWIKVNPNYLEINAEQQRKDANSVLEHYKRLIKLRKQHPVIVYGSFEALADEHPTVYAFLRTFYSERLLVIANFSETECTFTPPQLSYNSAKLLIGNYEVEEAFPGAMRLMAFETRVYLMDLGEK